VPWYWTDDIARALMEADRISADVAGPLMSIPIGIRREEPTLETAAEALVDDGEIPLAA